MSENMDISLELASIEKEQADYKVPDNIIEEVTDYLHKIQDPEITKEEWTRLLDWMKEKEEQDPNYKLARLELIISEDSKKHSTDPENVIHRIHELRSQLSKSAK